MNDFKHQTSDCSGNGPGKRPRGSEKSSDDRENPTARTLQYSATTCTTCSLPITKGENSKSIAGYNTTRSMDGALRSRLTPPVDHICLPLPQDVVSTTPEGRHVLASPPQSVPMQRGRANYVPVSRQPPSTAGITVTAGPTASPEYDDWGPFKGFDDAARYLLGQVPEIQLLNPVPRRLNGMSNGFLDRYVIRSETIEAAPVNSPGLCSLPDITSFLRHGGATAYNHEYQDNPNQVRLPPILSCQRNSSRESAQQSLADTTTTRCEHQGQSNQALPPRNPFAPSNSGLPSEFPIALRPKGA